jgi:arsenate reductase
MKIVIWHNPRCRKSREGYKFLEEKGVPFSVRNYLRDVPDEAELESVLKLMGAGPREIIRKGEKEYRELGLKDKNLSDKDLIKAMAEHPKLIERPIVIVDNKKAALGRPAENLEKLFS